MADHRKFPKHQCGLQLDVLIKRGEITIPL